MGKLLTKFLLVFAGIIAIAIGVAVVGRSRDKEFVPTLPAIASNSTPAPTQTTTVLSPDGKKTLVMKERNDEGGTKHTFLISSSDDGVLRQIFTKTLPSEVGLTIPYNAFSPDDKYLFLKEAGLDKTNYFVISTENENFEPMDISGLFETKLGSDYRIREVTGWGGVGLVVFNTDKVEGGVGHSFWFEVPSGAFIRLSHNF